MAQREGEVLVEEIPEEFTHAQVGPAAVNQQQTLQEAELGEGEVTGQHCLHPFLPADPHSYVGTWGKGHFTCNNTVITIKAFYSTIK